MHPKLMFDRKKNPENNHFGGYLFLCLPPYNSNFEAKSPILRTSNLRDFTVIVETSLIYTRQLSVTVKSKY